MNCSCPEANSPPPVLDLTPPVSWRTLLQQFSSLFFCMVTSSIFTGSLPPAFKQAAASALLKNAKFLGPSSLHYPISLLLFVAKLKELSVFSVFTSSLIFNLVQSNFCGRLRQVLSVSLTTSPLANPMVSLSPYLSYQEHLIKIFTSFFWRGGHCCLLILLQTSWTLFLRLFGCCLFISSKVIGPHSFIPRISFYFYLYSLPKRHNANSKCKTLQFIYLKF